jgi:hypothetical protein
MKRQFPFWGNASHFQIWIAAGVFLSIGGFGPAAWSCPAAAVSFAVSLRGREFRMSEGIFCIWALAKCCRACANFAAAHNCV